MDLPILGDLQGNIAASRHHPQYLQWSTHHMWSLSLHVAIMLQNLPIRKFPNNWLIIPKIIPIFVFWQGLFMWQVF